MLKWIALELMLVDHVAFIMEEFIPPDIYLAMRILGRITFPVFVYYVVLGLHRTSNLGKYIERLFIFAIISEIAIRAVGLFSNLYLNVIFSLLVYAVIYALYENKMKFKMNKIVRFGAIILLILLLPYVEYGYSGFLVFLSLYYIHNNVKVDNKSTYAFFLIALSFVPEILISNGSYVQLFAGIAGLLMFNKTLDKRILAPKVEKWTFYWFYPLQWPVLALVYNLFS